MLSGEHAHFVKKKLNLRKTFSTPVFLSKLFGTEHMLGYVCRIKYLFWNTSFKFGVFMQDIDMEFLSNVSNR